MPRAGPRLSPKLLVVLLFLSSSFVIIGRCVNIAYKSAEDLKGGIRPYSLTDHIHEREASRHLSSLIPSSTNPFSLAFIPNVAPWFSGIISVLTAPLDKSMRASEIIELYEEKYGKEPLVQIQKTVPDVTEVMGKHGWRVGGVQVHSSGKRVVVVVSRVLCARWQDQWIEANGRDRALWTTFSRVLPLRPCR